MPGQTTSSRPPFAQPQDALLGQILLNSEGRGTYCIEGGTSVHRRAETTSPGAPSLLLLVLSIHILSEEDLEEGSHEPGDA